MAQIGSGLLIWILFDTNAMKIQAQVLDPSAYQRQESDPYPDRSTYTDPDPYTRIRSPLEESAFSLDLHLTHPRYVYQIVIPIMVRTYVG